MSFSFKCRVCGETHAGMPALASDAPDYYYSIPPEEREARCELTTDTCVTDDRFYFLRGTIEIPVTGLKEHFCWGVWVSVSFESFKLLMEHWEDPNRSDIGPFFGWLSANLAVYPDTVNLKTNVELQAPPLRPLIWLEPTDHPLAVEQRMGISQQRLAETYAEYLH
ncbi:DUF2199 domain-containing protein [Alteriqipengyuania lutimaris]|uniref:DUF2199 domain-containing protein n=1 Tax=Alteriqipengyuania lutimaris TaxID=1538146 RepID=A0A395LR58_9SPHN|nr:DUF2199 domain-containing protein [Alteriqipengyuania lutimaris]MBB3032887.1 hypothetical protein [Alteriqipengyuania lutimaris]RDS78024.1 DUF2199 domain-containing protein [Alteriqipengyuania lutimaris]